MGARGTAGGAHTQRYATAVACVGFEPGTFYLRDLIVRPRILLLHPTDESRIVRQRFECRHYTTRPLK